MIQKTKVLTLIVFGLLFLNLSAQEDDYSNDPVAKLPDEDRKFRFGLQFSPSMSWLKANSTGYKSTGTEFGFSYGLSVEYFISKNYLFSSGLSMLTSKGGLKYKGVSWFSTATPVQSSYAYANNTEYVYKLKYVEIPLLLKMRTNEIGYLTYFGQFGFNAGFNYRSSGTYAATYFDSIEQLEKTQDVEIKDMSPSINFLNISLVIGGGVEYNISGNTSMTIGVTFNNGFINQLDTKMFQFDANGDPLMGTDGLPLLSEKDASANLNYLALNLGIYF